MTINALDYLINVKGLSKRHIARVIGVTSSKLTYVYGAKLVDPEILKRLHEHWPELKPQKPQDLEDYLKAAKNEVDDAVKDDSKAAYIQQQLGDVKAILAKIEKAIDEMKRNK
jgi:hypothetical protein